MDRGNMIDRRSFIKKAMVASAAIIAFGAAEGCSSGSGSSSTSTKTSSSSSSTSSAGSSTSAASTSSASSTASTTSASASGEYSTGTHHATIEVADYGTIEVELYADIAPITVANFADLASQGFYDGLTFHRIIKGFMVQGGDPKGNGTGGSGKTIKGEFSANGVKNSISFVRGTIAMARSQSYDSASSQFFIMQADNTSINGQYAGFGKVTSGIEIVDAMCDKVPVTDNNGTVAAANQPVMTSIKMVD